MNKNRFFMNDDEIHLYVNVDYELADLFLQN